MNAFAAAIYFPLSCAFLLTNSGMSLCVRIFFSRSLVCFTFSAILAAKFAWNGVFNSPDSLKSQNNIHWVKKIKGKKPHAFEPPHSKRTSHFTVCLCFYRAHLIKYKHQSSDRYERWTICVVFQCLCTHTIEKSRNQMLRKTIRRIGEITIYCGHQNNEPNGAYKHSSKQTRKKNCNGIVNKWNGRKL